MKPFNAFSNTLNGIFIVTHGNRINDLVCGENLPFYFKKKKPPKQHGHENFLKNFQKTHHISMKTIMKLPRFLEDLGIFLAFFF